MKTMRLSELISTLPDRLTMYVDVHDSQGLQQLQAITTLSREGSTLHASRLVSKEGMPPCYGAYVQDLRSACCAKSPGVTNLELCPQWGWGTATEDASRAVIQSCFEPSTTSAAAAAAPDDGAESGLEYGGYVSDAFTPGKAETVSIQILTSS